MNETPLHGIHIKSGAKMVSFGGWDMPVFYSGINAEHKAVRTSAGLFDIGHMGAVKITGAKALDYLNRILTNDASRLNVGDSQYSMFLNKSGGVIDDIFVYRLPDHFMLVINASNAGKDIEWMLKNNDEKINIVDLKSDLTLVALQGPKAQEILQKLCKDDLKTIGHHKIIKSKISNIESLISRTGYTGEDGFEMFFNRSKAEMIWNQLIKLGVIPCGLGARDTLRLEAGMPLYGHEYNEGLTPLETPFTFAVKMEKGDFIGKDHLISQREHGIHKKLVGIKMTEMGIPRQGYKIYKGNNVVGYVTSGTMSPTLGVPIGMGYVRIEYSEVGNKLHLEIRNKMIAAEVVKLPFYKRSNI